MKLLEMNTNLENKTELESELVRLVRAAQNDDREAFGELVLRYEQSIYALALRQLGDHTEAQELCQDVFVHALVKIYQLQQPLCIGSWLRTIAKRMVINRIVRAKPVISLESKILESLCYESTTPMDEMLAHERQSHVRAGLKRLRSMDRETLVAFYVKGHSLCEMSDEFGSPIGTIKRRLHVARKRLAEKLQDLAAV